MISTTIIPKPSSIEIIIYYQATIIKVNIILAKKTAIVYYKDIDKKIGSKDSFIR